jgi:peptide-methionine (S)-S-oxide reductase
MQVCTVKSGHVEVLYVELNEPEKNFEELVRFFFTFHDPTTPNSQGNDTGFQYASYIFVIDDIQRTIAEKVKDEFQKLVDAKKVTRFAKTIVTTKIGPVKDFQEAMAGSSPRVLSGEQSQWILQSFHFISS